ncbi:hypothetical protein Shyhy02_76480 [Streptomyces hygroscopicus subsp. hygroscopicus]|nr:hypothetical protein Shyhy02_76480 [Streptomyces hygroscopicus subsp. hygroscopicus]
MHGRAQDAPCADGVCADGVCTDGVCADGVCTAGVCAAGVCAVRTRCSGQAGRAPYTERGCAGAGRALRYPG